jgi:dihydropteroate synthase
MEWHMRGSSLDFTRSGQLMGILNVTPDSFSDSGNFLDFPSAMAHARRLIAEGAAVIDVGGESSRPGSEPVSLEEELRRVVPVIRALHAEYPHLLISIDTYKAETARQALEAGASIVNDISALRADPQMASVVSRYRAGVILMHMQGTPKTMQCAPHYDDVVNEVMCFLRERRDAAIAAAIEPACIALDPGFGFGKNLAHNLALLRSAGRLGSLGRPVVAGISKKSTLARLLGDPGLAMSERIWPSVAFTSYLREHGIKLLRVHEIKPHLEALRMTEAIIAG